MSMLELQLCTQQACCTCKHYYIHTFDASVDSASVDSAPYQSCQHVVGLFAGVVPGDVCHLHAGVC